MHLAGAFVRAAVTIGVNSEERERRKTIALEGVKQEKALAMRALFCTRTARAFCSSIIAIVALSSSGFLAAAADLRLRICCPLLFLANI